MVRPGSHPSPRLSSSPEHTKTRFCRLSIRISPSLACFYSSRNTTRQQRPCFAQDMLLTMMPNIATVTNTATTTATTTMEPLLQSSMRDPFAHDYADYSQGYDQWQMWAKRNRTMSRRGRSLLSNMVDPRVQRHMVLATGGKCEAVPTKQKATATRWRKKTAAPRRAGTAEFCPATTLLDHHKYHKKEPPSVCSSTKASSESDDNSSAATSVYPSTASLDPAWEEPITDYDWRRSHNVPGTLEQPKQQPKQPQPFVMNRAVQPPPTKHPRRRRRPRDSCNKNVTLLPSHRVKRAMERGESVRILTCSGCACELLVTTDLPLVYCSQCHSFSRLPAAALR